MFVCLLSAVLYFPSHEQNSSGLFVSGAGGMLLETSQQHLYSSSPDGRPSFNSTRGRVEAHLPLPARPPSRRRSRRVWLCCGRSAGCVPSLARCLCPSFPGESSLSRSELGQNQRRIVALRRRRRHHNRLGRFPCCVLSDSDPSSSSSSSSSLSSPSLSSSFSIFCRRLVKTDCRTMESSYIFACGRNSFVKEGKNALPAPQKGLN